MVPDKINFKFSNHLKYIFKNTIVNSMTTRKRLKDIRSSLIEYTTSVCSHINLQMDSFELPLFLTGFQDLYLNLNFEIGTPCTNRVPDKNKFKEKYNVKIAI